jgi:hypothetical protein
MNWVTYPALIISTGLIKPVNSVSHCCWHVCCRASLKFFFDSLTLPELFRDRAKGFLWHVNRQPLEKSWNNTNSAINLLAHRIKVAHAFSIIQKG